MASGIVDGKFACAQCDKKFKWKPELAGKKAKCGCGAVLTVPEPADEGEYELAEAPEPALASAAILTPPPVRDRALEYSIAKARAAAAGETKSPDVMVDRFRDIYLPNALLVISGFALLAWSSRMPQAGVATMATVSTLIGLATAIKTAILLGLALLFASKLGIGFGEFRSAVLKFAAIIITTDVALLWLDAAMKSAGGMPTSGHGGTVYALLIPLGCTTAIISCLSHYLFDMDRDETGLFALPMAFIVPCYRSKPSPSGGTASACPFLVYVEAWPSASTARGRTRSTT